MQKDWNTMTIKTNFISFLLKFYDTIRQRPLHFMFPQQRKDAVFGILCLSDNKKVRFI